MKLQSLEQITRALNESGVRFIIVGGLAVVAHGYARHTQDLDLVIHLDPASIHATFAALAGLGYRPRVPIASADFADPAQRSRWINDKGMTVLNFFSDQHRETPVDLFVTQPFDFDTEYNLAMAENIAPNTPARVIRLDTLIQMKLLAGRPQDLADVAELRLIHKDDFNG